jgi:hypothetical protein
MDTRARHASGVSLVFSVSLIAGCVGYRTPMDPAENNATGSPAQRDAGSGTRPDSAIEIGRDTGKDAAKDVLADLRPDLLPDGRPEVRPDLPPDVTPDVRPDLLGDVRPEVRPDLPPDGRPDLPPEVRPDLPTDGRILAACPSGEHFVLLLGGDGRLYRFDSFNLALTTLATVSCGTQSLNSLTVSPIGPAYISSMTGDLCSVDLTTFTSTLTSFSPLLIGTTSYGMALLPDNSAAGQTLYIAVEGGTNVNHLKSINLTTYALTSIGDISPAVPWAELTAGPNGELYGFSVGTTESLLLNIDPKTASAIDVTHVPAGYQFAAFALVYWQDGFYLFLSGSSTQASSVYHYRKGDAQVTTVGTVNASIIGAGVAACP